MIRLIVQGPLLSTLIELFKTSRIFAEHSFLILYVHYTFIIIMHIDSFASFCLFILFYFNLFYFFFLKLRFINIKYIEWPLEGKILYIYTYNIHMYKMHS